MLRWMWLQACGENPESEYYPCKIKCNIIQTFPFLVGGLEAGCRNR